MFEISIDIQSNLYRIYKESLGRWECPPTKTSLPSFAYVMFLYILRRFSSHIRVVINIVLAAIAMMSTAWMLEVVVSVAEWDQPLFWIILLSASIFSTTITVLTVRHCKTICSILYRKVSTAVRWVRSRILMPTVRFTGHPRSSYDIEKFSE